MLEERTLVMTILGESSVVAARGGDYVRITRLTRVGAGVSKGSRSEREVVVHIGAVALQEKIETAYHGWTALKRKRHVKCASGRHVEGIGRGGNRRCPLGE